MALTVKDLIATADAVVERIDGARARQLLAEGALLLDVRDAPELETAGRAQGSLHIPRGMLEFRADPGMPSYNPELRPDRTIIVHCATGGRAALAGKVLKDMGYARVFNVGGLKDYAAAGGALIAPADSGE